MAVSVYVKRGWVKLVEIQRRSSPWRDGGWEACNR